MLLPSREEFRSGQPVSLEDLKEDFFPAYWTPARAAKFSTGFLFPATSVIADATKVALAWNPFLAGLPAPARRKMHAWAEVAKLCTTRWPRPEFGIDSVPINGRAVPVELANIAERLFCALGHFDKPDQTDKGPRVLLIPPYSGHYETLLRGTVETMVRGHDLYMLRWNDVSSVPVSAGLFGLSKFINEVVWAIRKLCETGQALHVVAVCQPTVAAAVAVAQIYEDRDICVPASMTLMAGPIDTRKNPTKINEFAKSRSLKWMNENLFVELHGHHGEAGREVLQGFLQLCNFMAMNPERHEKAFRDLADFLAANEMQKAQKIIDFYKEYLAVMDLAKEFIMDTAEQVFHRAALAEGSFYYTDEMGQRRKANPAAIDRRTMLLTVEGAKDDVCGIGQTRAALELCSNVPLHLKRHHEQADVGHYGVFTGQKWRDAVYPHIESHILAAQSRHDLPAARKSFRAPGLH